MRYEKEWASFHGKQQKRSYLIKEIMSKFSDGDLDRIANILKKQDASRMSLFKVFFTAFSRHPLVLLKVFKLFK